MQGERIRRILVIATFVLLAMVSPWAAIAQSTPAATATATASPPPQPPIKTVTCGYLFENADTGTPLIITTSFRNDSEKVAIHVRFRFVLENAYNQYVKNMPTGEVQGHFSPGILIEPKKASITGVPLIADATYPSSPAWEIFNRLGKDLYRITCIPDAARFEDGSTWSSR